MQQFNFQAFDDENQVGDERTREQLLESLTRNTEFSDDLSESEYLTGDTSTDIHSPGSTSERINDVNLEMQSSVHSNL